MHWTSADAVALLPGGKLDRDGLDRAEALEEAASLDPAVAEQIRRMRAMGVNEGLVLVPLIQ